MKEYDIANVLGLLFSCIKKRSYVIVLPFRYKSTQSLAKLKYLSFVVTKFSVYY
jgi:hypothetical protein